MEATPLSRNNEWAIQRQRTLWTQDKERKQNTTQKNRDEKYGHIKKYPPRNKVAQIETDSSLNSLA